MSYKKTMKTLDVNLISISHAVVTQEAVRVALESRPWNKTGRRLLREVQQCIFDAIVGFEDGRKAGAKKAWKTRRLRATGKGGKVKRDA